MCGITGIYSFKGTGDIKTAISRMTNALAHRGPDAEGYFNTDHIAFGHRRLAIIDLSTDANQPFTDASGRYIMVFNGEMYNYQDVKNKLPNYPFRTSSDTETILAAYIQWGPACLQHFRGMFAFAIWDKQQKELFVARDPMGVKPLYYFKNDSVFVFASEIRAVLASGFVPKKVNHNALLEYFSFQSIGQSLSAIERIEQLEAGCWMKVNSGQLEIKRYWDIMTARPSFDFADKESVQHRVRELMLQSIKRRLVSDVPVGAFLSGGIDSSAVVGLMAEAANTAPNTFTVAFEEKDFDESGYAALVANKFKTHHTNILLKPNDFLYELPNALDGMDTPSGDGINTYVVSKAIRNKGMTVALSGVGGDELFAGYPIFSQYLKIQHEKWLWQVPGRRGIAALMPKRGRNGRLKQLLRLPGVSIDEVYPLFRQILSPAQIHTLTGLNGTGRLHTSLHDALVKLQPGMEKMPLLSQVSVAEYTGYTQHTLLKDTDQMGMAVALEVREPYFDQDLVEFVLAIPDEIKRPTYPKSLLVESLKPLLPDEVVFRPKKGFLFPWKHWLRNELRSFCDQHIKNMAQRSFIKGDPLLAMWDQFLKEDESIRWVEIWLFVVLEYWMERNEIE